MPMPLCHILRARLRQQGKGDKSTLPVRDNSTLRLQPLDARTGVMVQARVSTSLPILQRQSPRQPS